MTKDKLNEQISEFREITEGQELYKIIDDAAEDIRAMATTDLKYSDVRYREKYNASVDSMLELCVKETKHTLAKSYKSLLHEEKLNTSNDKNWLLDLVVTTLLLKMCEAYMHSKIKKLSDDST